MILMVTGGRHFGMVRRNEPELLSWSERNIAVDAFNHQHAEAAISRLIHGECPVGGTDLLADLWARSHSIPVDPVPVDHRLDGPWPGAGPRRSGRMIAKRPDRVLALPGGSGTDNAVDQALKAGIEVIDLRCPR